MLGDVLFAMTFYLFSFAGAKIVAVFSLIIGILFMTNLSLGNLYAFLKKNIQKVYKFWQEKRENKRVLEKEKAETKSQEIADRKSTRLNSSHVAISYAVFCLKKKKQ